MAGSFHSPDQNVAKAALMEALAVMIWNQIVWNSALTAAAVL